MSGLASYITRFVRTSWRLLLVASLLLNLGLGFLNFVLQPIWKAAAVTSAVLTTKTNAELAERRAVARARAEAEVAERKAVEATKINEQAEAKAKRTAAVQAAVAATKIEAELEQKEAVSRAIAKEKAKGRVRRIAVAVPVIGTAIAAGFEYWDYTQWKNDHPEGDVEQYAHEVAPISAEVANEVINELPEGLRFDPEKLWKANEWIINKVASFDAGGWEWPDVTSEWFNPLNWSLWGFESDVGD